MADHREETRENANVDRFQIERRRIPIHDVANQIGEGNPRFGVVRDRLFHAMLVRISLTYYVNFTLIFRRIIEFVTLLNAITLLAILIYTHFLVSNYSARCVDGIMHNWPMKGIVRVEVIKNLEKFKELQEMRERKAHSSNVCHFDLKEVLRSGKLPPEIQDIFNDNESLNGIPKGPPERRRARRLLQIWLDSFFWLVEKIQKMKQNAGNDDGDVHEIDETRNSTSKEEHEDGIARMKEFNENVPVYNYLFEFSLHYGLLRLSPEVRQELSVDILLVQLDAEKDACFREWHERFLMRYLVGMDELIMASVKQLAENQTERGYLRDLIGGELYHFVSIAQASTGNYLTALIVMLVFTFAISMLLRFSHDQIFVFIVDLFQMFEQNQPLIFPIAPMLTVILALVGMEAIMSEIFNDASTAFYVILLVWMADQYDAIFCHSSIAKRYWLRFFYLYHFSFYAYQYHYNGLYSSLALLTSAAFTLHSMVFFFHHYELPHIIFQEHLTNAVQFLQNTEVDGSVEVLQVRQNNRNPAAIRGNAPINVEGNLSDVLPNGALRAAISTILENQPTNSNTSTTNENVTRQAASIVNERGVQTDQASSSNSLPQNRTQEVVESLANSVVDEAMHAVERIFQRTRLAEGDVA